MVVISDLTNSKLIESVGTGETAWNNSVPKAAMKQYCPLPRTENIEKDPTPQAPSIVRKRSKLTWFIVRLKF